MQEILLSGLVVIVLHIVPKLKGSNLDENDGLLMAIKKSIPQHPLQGK
jgi:hypothetical protein